MLTPHWHAVDSKHAVGNALYAILQYIKFYQTIPVVKADAGNV